MNVDELLKEIEVIENRSKQFLLEVNGDTCHNILDSLIPLQGIHLMAKERELLDQSYTLHQADTLLKELGFTNFIVWDEQKTYE